MECYLSKLSISGDFKGYAEKELPADVSTLCSTKMRIDKLTLESVPKCDKIFILILKGDMILSENISKNCFKNLFDKETTSVSLGSIVIQMNKKF